MASVSERLDGDTGNLGAPSVEQQINAIGMGRFQHVLIGIFGLIVVADGMEMVVISLLYTALHKDWGISKLEEGLLAGVIFMGFLVGNIVGGYLGDQWGRRNTLLLSGGFFLVSATLSAFAPDLITLCILRSCVGMAVGCKLPVATAILIELTPSKDRGVCGMLISGIAFALGEMLVCVAGIAIHSVEHSSEWWRILLLACVIPDLIGFPLAWFFVPESPSWLIMRGRHEEVEELLEHVAMTNTSSLDCLLQGGRIRKVRDNSTGQEDWASFMQSVEGLFMRKIRQTTVFLMIIWSVCCFVYYGHVFVYPLVLEQRYHMQLENQYFAVLLAGAAEIPGVIIGMFLIDLEGVGRRRSILFFLLAGSLAALMVPLFSDSYAFVGANMVLKTLINTPFCILYVFAAELFPTTHRAFGIAFCSSTSRLAGALSPVITAWSVERSITLTYELFATALAVGAVATFLFESETLNVSLPQSLDADCGRDRDTSKAEVRPLKTAGMIDDKLL